MPRWLPLFVTVLIAFWPSPGFARKWTVNGKEVEAKFVRVFDDKVVLSWYGRVVQIPLSSLTPDERAYVDAVQSGEKPPDDIAKERSASTESTELNADEPREWNDVQGRKITAKFVEVEDDRIVLDRDGKKAKVAFEKLSKADQQFVHQVLKDRGLKDTLPDAPTGDTAAEKNAESSKSRTGAKSPVALRLWTDYRGKKIQARLLKVNGDKVVLIFRNKPVDFPFKELSPPDKEYVRTWLTERGQGDQIAALDAPVAAPSAVAFAPPPSFGSPRLQNAMNEMHQRMAESSARAQQQHQQFMQQAEQQRQADAQRRQQFEQQAQQQAQQQREQAERARRESEERMRQMQASVVTPQINMPSSPHLFSGQTADQWECSNCKHVMTSIPSNYKCPSCGTTFEEIVEPSGKHKSTGAVADGGGWRVRRIIIPGPKLILGVIVGIFSAVAACWRKLFGSDD